MGWFARRDAGGARKCDWRIGVCALAFGAAGLGPAASARASCSLPATFGIAAEEHGLLDRGSAGVVVSAPSPDVGLAVGDVIRQANGLRVERCADLERAAADALAQGLVLLLAIERGETRVAVAAMTQQRAAREGAIAGTTTGGSGETVASAAPAADAPGSRPGRASVEPAPAPTIEPPPRREAALPPRTGASGALVRRAEVAARALAAVDATAQPVAPLALYERRLGEAEATIGALEFGVDAQESAVRDFVEDALALHRAARDVHRLQLETMAQRGLDRRTPLANGLPYFSTSKVPQLVRAYPFLQPCILESPRDIRVPVPGEVAGRWSPDQALDILWTRTHAAQAALTAWAAGA